MKQQAILYLKTLHCIHETHEAGSDSVYMYVYGDGIKLGRYPTGNNVWHMSTGDADSIDLEINCTYLDSIDVHLYERDSSVDDPDGKDEDLGVIKFDRSDLPEGTKKVYQAGDAPGIYSIDYRLITNPIPTVRVLGIRCESQSAGMDVETFEEVVGAASTCAEAAGEVIGKSPRPRAKVISKAFDEASKVLNALSHFGQLIGGLIEGKDDVYMKHVAESNSRSYDGGFFPSGSESIYKMEKEDEVCFEQYNDGNKYFRFPLDEGPVTIQLREHDSVKQDINIGTISITPNSLNSNSNSGVDGSTENGGIAIMDGPAVVEIANSYGEREGEGAVYHICYSIGMEDWSLPATAEGQGEIGYDGIYKNPAHGLNTYDGVIEHTAEMNNPIPSLAEMRALIQRGIPKEEGWATDGRYWVLSDVYSTEAISVNIITGEAFTDPKTSWKYYTWRTYSYEYKDPAHGLNTYEGVIKHTDEMNIPIPSLAEMRALIEQGYISYHDWPTDTNYWVKSEDPSSPISVNMSTGETHTETPKSWMLYTWKLSGDAPTLSKRSTRLKKTKRLQSRKLNIKRPYC